MGELEVYARQNFGNRLGFGTSPALLIVDFVNAFDDPSAFGGGNIHDAVLQTVRLLDAFRGRSLPIAMTRVVYSSDGSDVGVFAGKLPGIRTLTEDAKGSQIVPELTPNSGEYVVRKTQPSAFFGTELMSWLIQRRVDTLFVAGATTSGCVRASVVDAMSMNFRPIVIRECVGDRAIGPHEANLFDMEQKYADVIGIDEALIKIKSLG